MIEKICRETQTNYKTKGHLMSALPFISHHLFAAAVHKDGITDKPARKNEPITQATDIPLELLDWTRPLPDGMAKSMRGGPSVRKS
jgi:hypothetical protein